MIYFVVREAVRWGIDDYLAGPGAPVAGRVGTITYEEFPSRNSLRPGTYIFTQRDALLPAELDISKAVWRKLSEVPSVRLLNDPSRILGRYELIRTLHRQGLNDFKAARATDDLSDLRFPLFIREERHHTGSLTSLLHTPQELDQALGDLLVRGWRRSDLLVVEFWDTRDERGRFRKYSAYVMGTEIIPRSLIFSRHWMVKAETKTRDDDVIEAEFEYVRTNPHGEWLRQVFSAAGIQYGRIDYGLLGDRPQAWEINLYPTLVRPSWQPPSADTEYRALREPTREIFFRRFTEALEAADVEAPPGAPIPVRLDEVLLARLRKERRMEALRTLHLRAFRKASEWRALHPLWRLLGPLGARVGTFTARMRRRD